MVALLLIYHGCQHLTAQSGNSPDDTSGVHLIAGTEQFNGEEITGKIKNDTGHDVDSATVDINLYDRDGNQVGSTMDIVNSLDAGATWNFKAPVIEDNAQKFRIVDITEH